MKTVNNFNSHAHVERDYRHMVWSPWNAHFNSHAHVERDGANCVRNEGVSYFNSHAHVERDYIFLCLFKHLFISTHTLTWSVTRRMLKHLEQVQFQLTRSRGAWPVAKYENGAILHFNSHAHVERDGVRRFIMLTTKISTHTLTWSVTVAHCIVDIILQFQLTRSRGAWRLYTGFKYSLDDFNSHAHVERDNWG